MTDVARSVLRPPRVPQATRSRFLPLGSERRATIEQSLRKNFFADANSHHASANGYLETPEGRDDLDNHIAGRLHAFRTWTVPWLDSLLKLDGARILELGCGTGASTIALAEQGARVVGVDISAGALVAAQDRCDAYGLKAQFVQANVTSIPSVFAGEQFDAVLFFAVLEHLTWEERISSLRAAWELLAPGGILAVIEAPNRLWYVDIHTTSEPFYHWLPDEAAIAYTRYVGGPSRNLFNEPAETARVNLARLGRGVSYHEFVIAWNIPPNELPVASYMTRFHRWPWTGAVDRLSAGGRFRRLLSRAAPYLHPAFLQASLDVAFRKNGEQTLK